MTLMGIIVNGRDAVDGDIGRQQSIEAMDEALDVVDGFLGVEVRDHQLSIHAGIGAACSCHRCGNPQQRAHCFLQCLLH